jgi:hypothetical protein
LFRLLSPDEVSPKLRRDEKEPPVVLFEINVVQFIKL